VCDTDTLLDMCSPDMDAETMALVQRKAKDAIEREVIVKHIKKLTKHSIAAIKETCKESFEKDSISSYFNGGQIVWDDVMGLFVEVHNDFVKYHNKSNFIQTVRSRSGWMSQSDASEILCEIPCENIIYDPTHTHKDGINIHKRVAFKTGYKKVPRTIRRLLDNLFIEDPEARDVFINWLAVILQKGIRTGVAWIFYGAQGSGKGLLVDIITKLLGQANVSVNIGDVALQSDFNPYLKHVQFIHLNEIASDFHGRHGVSGKLKAMVTDPFIQINEKNTSEYMVENFANVVVNSNKPDPIEVDMDDRRYNAIVSSRSLSMCSWWKGDVTYKRCMEEFEDFGSYLMQYEVNHSLATTPMLKSKAKESLSLQTTSPLLIIGKLIKDGNFDGILEFLDLDDNFQGISIDDIEKACILREWSTTLLNKIHCLTVGKDNMTANATSRRFIKPYITLEPSRVQRKNGNIIRYYYI